MLSAIAGKVLLNEPDDPHTVLSSLPFPIYITANFNNFLADSLRRSGREPLELLFNSDIPIAGLDAPDSNRPLVYHLYGKVNDAESLVLTEDDYFHLRSNSGVTGKESLVSCAERLQVRVSCFSGLI